MPVAGAGVVRLTSGMFAPDVLTCYAITGLSALGGLGLLSLVDTDQPRVRYALRRFRWAMLALSALLVSWLVPPAWQGPALQMGICSASAGVALLAWAFRHLHGGRTPPTVGLAACTLVAGLPVVVALAGNDQAYVRAMGAAFVLSSGFMAVDQGIVAWRKGHPRGADLILLLAAWLFCADWLALFAWAWWVPGPYAAHWLHAPAWLLAPTCLGFAILPLGVASVVFAAINARLNQQLRARALSDELTGALSRRGLRELGERLLSFQAQPSQVLAVLMLDLDHFKAINDRHGHPAGDQVLRHVAQVVREHLREDALVARYGGEEFTILLPVRSRSEGLLVAERLRERVASLPCPWAGLAVPVTVSIGVAMHQPEATLEDDLGRADAALYQAKQAGRNRVVAAPQPAVGAPVRVPDGGGGPERRGGGVWQPTAPSRI